MKIKFLFNHIQQYFSHLNTNSILAPPTCLHKFSIKPFLLSTPTQKTNKPPLSSHLRPTHDYARILSRGWTALKTDAAVRETPAGWRTSKTWLSSAAALFSVRVCDDIVVFWGCGGGDGLIDRRIMSWESLNSQEFIR